MDERVTLPRRRARSWREMDETRRRASASHDDNRATVPVAAFATEAPSALVTVHSVDPRPVVWSALRADAVPDRQRRGART